MKPKVKTQAMIRAEAEAEAQKRERAQQEREAVATRKAKEAYDGLWKQFSKDLKISKSTAYANVLKNLTDNASLLVPFYMTAKEHMAMVSEAASNVKGDDRGGQEDPRQLMASWLRGETDLSRIPLDKVH